ncbi:sodium/hydrogen exchanger family domain-containing protein [Ditylenchus destructor]|nr:sodium/hydrogen exchanger family domain-containing protein [Ditylenchus destructor]
MPNRQLFENIDSILLFAILGTIWNTIAIGGTLMLFNQFDFFSIGFSTFEILLFAALISAVDPVAVFAVFEEVGINEFLFINVFGEALFNDSVSVMLYQMCRKFIDIGESRLVLIDYVAGAFSFFVIAIGGIIIGVIMALIVSIITRFTSRVKIVAPVFIFVVPYLAFLTAEMFGVSSILAFMWNDDETIHQGQHLT